MRKPTIAISMGDPAGIGPELAIKVASNIDFQKRSNIVVYGEKSILTEAVKRFGNGSEVNIQHCGNFPFNELIIGKAQAKSGTASLEALRCATEDVIAKKADAIVTAPMNKYAVNLAKVHFVGHTEYIAEKTSCNNYVMMQSANSLRMVFVTTHIPYREVPEVISIEKIIATSKLLIDAIKSEGITSPKIAVAALNPHAGENGVLGNEEEDIIIPAINELVKQGNCVYGPIVPDVLFMKNIREKYDGIVCMYHDQGHIPFKMLAFDCGVNSTLGLPIIRTSPDHGSAYEIAWQNIANTGSMFSAVDLAIKRSLKVVK